jgi:hypothetical protein
VIRIVILVEGKGVVGVQPAVIKMTSLISAPDFDHNFLHD